MTRLGIDLRIIHYAKTGFYRYAQGLLTALEGAATRDREVLLLRHPEDCGHALPGSHLREVAVKTPCLTPRRPAIARGAGSLQLDMIHFPLSLFPAARPRVILTVHDLTCLRFPHFIEPQYCLLPQSAAQAGQADRIVTPSNASPWS